MRFLKRINERGTLTLPAEIREVLGVEDGDIVEFEVLGVVRKRRPDGTVEQKETRTTYRAEIPGGSQA